MFATQFKFTGAPVTIMSAFVKFSRCIRKCKESIIAAKIAFRTRSYSTRRNTMIIGETLPFLPMVRCSQVSCVTSVRGRSNQIDANAAQCCKKLEIDFHFPLIKSLLTRMDWSSLRRNPFIWYHSGWGLSEDPTFEAHIPIGNTQRIKTTSYG